MKAHTQDLFEVTVRTRRTPGGWTYYVRATDTADAARQGNLLIWEDEPETQRTCAVEAIEVREIYVSAPSATAAEAEDDLTRINRACEMASMGTDTLEGLAMIAENRNLWEAGLMTADEALDRLQGRMVKA